MRGGQNRTSRYARPKMLCAGAPEDVVCRFCLEQGCLVRHDNALRAVSAAAVARGAQARRSRSRVPSFPASPGTEHSPDGVRLCAACCAQRVPATKTRPANAWLVSGHSARVRRKSKLAVRAGRKCICAPVQFEAAQPARSPRTAALRLSLQQLEKLVRCSQSYRSVGSKLVNTRLFSVR